MEEAGPAENTTQGKKPTSGNLLLIAILAFYFLCFIGVVAAGVWLSYSVWQTAAEKRNIPYGTATALADWPILFKDDFSKVSDVWYVGSYSRADYTDSRSINKGEYTWEISSPDGYTFWQDAGLEQMTDFVLSVDVRHLSGSSHDGYGLAFHNLSSNHYLFYIFDDGRYALYVHTAGQWNKIISPTYSSLIRPGEYNHLTVEAQGEHFQFFINNSYVDQVTDATLTGGDVGMFLDLSSEQDAPGNNQPQGVVYSPAGASSSVAFDNFEVRAPEKPASAENRPPELPHIRPAGGRLVFASDQGGNRNIYTVNSDGSGLKQLTDDPAADYGPRWSPDGKKIVFASRRDGNSEIYVMDADGGHPTRLTDDPGEDMSPDWSPDGRQIVFASNRKGNFDIYLMSAGGEKDSLSRLTLAKYDEIKPSVSPDGTEILYQGKINGPYRLMLISISGGGGTEIPTYYWDMVAADAAWSPDGLRIAYVERRANILGQIAVDLAHIDPNIYTREQVTSNMGSCQYPNWSPDGEQLVFVSKMDGQADIYIILPDGSGLYRVTHNEANEESPDWTQP